MRLSKLNNLIGVSCLLIVLELFSLSGNPIPDPYALPIYLFFILAFGRETLLKGFQALFQFNFQSINLLMVIAVLGALYLKEYPEAAIVIILFTLAEHLEDIGIEKSRSALNNLIEKMPKTALLKGSSTPINCTDVKVGDIISIKPSQFIPLDGIVKEGSSFVDESSITGEPLVKDKCPSDQVYAGTWNKQGFLDIEVTKNAEHSTLQKIKDLTLNALNHKAETQKFIEKFSQYYTPTIMLLALFWLLFNWLYIERPFLAGFAESLMLLVIACPCALVISTPISIFSAIGNASSKGILIKGGRYLEAIGQIKALALDKTRTLTHGQPIVTDVIPFGDESREFLLSCAAGIEALSEHPLAQSIVSAAEQENLTLHAVKNFESVIGKGARAHCLVCDEPYHLIGKLQFILEEHPVPKHVMQQVEKLQNEGKTVVVVSTANEVEGLIAVEDKIRADSAPLIAQLKKLGVEPILLTGDNSSIAQTVAKTLKIESVKSNLLPEDKAKEIQNLVKNYSVVGMFGDGINDAPALALASVGISMSGLGSDAAIETAAIVLLNDQLELIPFLIRLGRKTISIIKLNTIFAISIKLIFIILALLGMSNLALAIFADVGVTIIVIVLSLRLMKLNI